MARTLLVFLAAAGAAVLLAALVPAGAASREEPQEVVVTNFPDPQRIEGSVSIEGVVRRAILETVREVDVVPVAPSETTRLVPGGILTTDGFPEVVLSLAATTKGVTGRAGEVGAILLPDDEPIVQVMEEKRLFQFPLEVKAEAPMRAPHLSSGSPRLDVAFPRYRIFFYNTTDRTVTVTLYAYLTG